MERRVVFTAIKTHPMIRTVCIVVNLLLVGFVFFAEGIFIDSAKRYTIGPDPKRGPALFSIVARVRRQKGAAKFALMMSQMEGGCRVDYNTITDLFLQKNLIREVMDFLLDVLKPNLHEHSFLPTKSLSAVSTSGSFFAHHFDAKMKG